MCCVLCVKCVVVGSVECVLCVYCVASQVKTENGPDRVALGMVSIWNGTQLWYALEKESVFWQQRCFIT